MGGAHVNVNKPWGAAGNFASTGAGLGLDLGIKLGRAIYIGGGLEFGKASKGDGITNAPADGGFRVDPDNYSVSSFYLYPMLAFFSSNDKLGFWADLNAGIRTYSITQSKNADASFSMGGIDVGAGVGAIVPAGPMRIIPRLGLTLGYNSATTPKVKELGADVKSGVLGLGTSSYYDDKGTGFSGVLFLGVNGFFTADLF